MTLEKGKIVYYCDDNDKIRECMVISHEISINRLKEGNYSATINIIPKKWLKTDSPEMFTEIPIEFIFDNKHHCGYNKY
jgi:hypothetical protein